jgi:RNA 2',3'-cyclic 3'-phosphodiesterase
MELKRCFIALDFPRDIRNEIKRIQNRLWKKTLFTGKLTELENLHLTLKFLGEIDEKVTEEVKRKLNNLDFERFVCKLGRVGVFSSNFIRIVWIEVKGRGAFDLQNKIDEKLEGLFKKEERFMGHITIARVKNVRDKKALLEYLKSLKPQDKNFEVNEFYLKESELSSEGPVYKDIQGYKLGDKKI